MDLKEKKQTWVTSELSLEWVNLFQLEKEMGGDWHSDNTAERETKRRKRAEPCVFTFLYRSERFRKTYTHQVNLQLVLFDVMSLV